MATLETRITDLERGTDQHAAIVFTDGAIRVGQVLRPAPGESLAAFLAGIEAAALSVICWPVPLPKAKGGA